MERLGDQISFLGRVIVRTARGYSVEANPKYIRDVIAVLGLEGTRDPWTPSVKRTPTTESLVELENEKRAVHRTAVGKLLYMCQERADIMYSVKETARKIICTAERDEMNVKRQILEKCPKCKVFDRDQHISTVRERVHRQWLGKKTPNVQEHKRWSHAAGQRDSFCMVKNTTVSELEFCRSRIIRPDTTGEDMRFGAEHASTRLFQSNQKDDVSIHNLASLRPGILPCGAQ